MKGVGQWCRLFDQEWCGEAVVDKMDRFQVFEGRHQKVLSITSILSCTLGVGRRLHVSSIGLADASSVVYSMEVDTAMVPNMDIWSLIHVFKMFSSSIESVEFHSNSTEQNCYGSKTPVTRKEYPRPETSRYLDSNSR